MIKTKQKKTCIEQMSYHSQNITLKYDGNYKRLSYYVNTHTHTHTHIYIYIYVCVCVCVGVCVCVCVCTVAAIS